MSNMEKKQWLTIVAALLAVVLAIERLLCPVVLSTSECMLVLGELCRGARARPPSHLWSEVTHDCHSRSASWRRSDPSSAASDLSHCRDHEALWALSTHVSSGCTGRYADASRRSVSSARRASSIRLSVHGLRCGRSMFASPISSVRLRRISLRRSWRNSSRKASRLRASPSPLPRRVTSASVRR